MSAQLKAELAQYFNKTLPRFEVPVIQHGTAFERTVWAALCDTPMGQTSAMGLSQRVLANRPPRGPVGQMCWRLWFHATGLYRQTGRWRAIAAGCGASGDCSRSRRHNLYQTACDVQNRILPNTDTLKPTHFKTQTLLRHWRSKTLARLKHWDAGPLARAEPVLACCPPERCRSAVGPAFRGSVICAGLPSAHSPKFAALL